MGWEGGWHASQLGPETNGEEDRLIRDEESEQFWGCAVVWQNMQPELQRFRRTQRYAVICGNIKCWAGWMNNMKWENKWIVSSWWQRETFLRQSTWVCLKMGRKGLALFRSFLTFLLTHKKEQIFVKSGDQELVCVTMMWQPDAAVVSFW